MPHALTRPLRPRHLPSETVLSSGDSTTWLVLSKAHYGSWRTGCNETSLEARELPGVTTDPRQDAPGLGVRSRGRCHQTPGIRSPR